MCSSQSQRVNLTIFIRYDNILKIISSIVFKLTIVIHFNVYGIELAQSSYRMKIMVHLNILKEGGK